MKFSRDCPACRHPTTYWNRLFSSDEFHYKCSNCKRTYWAEGWSTVYPAEGSILDWFLKKIPKSDDHAKGFGRGWMMLPLFPFLIICGTLHKIIYDLVIMNSGVLVETGAKRIASYDTRYN